MNSLSQWSPAKSIRHVHVGVSLTTLQDPPFLHSKTEHKSLGNNFSGSFESSVVVETPSVLSSISGFAVEVKFEVLDVVKTEGGFCNFLLSTSRMGKLITK